MDLWVGQRHIAPGEPCYIIAEVGLAHDGSLAQAHAYIGAVSTCGVDAVKFQNHAGDPTSEWRVRPDWCADESRQAYWDRTSFTPAQWQELARHCACAGVEFLCSVFSLEAFRVIDPLVRMHKVPSGRVDDVPLLYHIARTGKPTLLSAGMASEKELRKVKMFFPDFAWLQCTSVYPCPPEQIGLSLVQQYGGLSDHSGTIWPGIAAAALGCQVLEIHVCFDRRLGLDGSASLIMSELHSLVEGVRFVEAAMQPVSKQAMALQLADTRRVFMHA